MTKEEAKHLSEVLKAYSEGKEIEVRVNDKIYNGWSDWTLVNVPHDFNTELIPLNVQYRIKPEVNLRPYANAEDFLKAQKEHGPWIYKSNKNQFYKIAAIEFPEIYLTFWNNDSKKIDVFNQNMTVIANKDIFKWQDGTPCGITKEEKQ